MISRCVFVIVILLMAILPETQSGLAGSPKQQPRRASPTGGKRVKALFTRQKRHPSKAEQNVAFEDYQIPPNQRRLYVADYRVPISLGGSNAYANIEVLTREQARQKKVVQKDLERRLQKGTMSEQEAQAALLEWQQQLTVAPKAKHVNAQDGTKSP